MDDEEWNKQTREMEKRRKFAVHEHWAQRLREDGYIVIAPSERKVRKLGRFTIITDPIGFEVHW